MLDHHTKRKGYTLIVNLYLGLIKRHTTNTSQTFTISCLLSTSNTVLEKESIRTQTLMLKQQQSHVTWLIQHRWILTVSHYRCNCTICDFHHPHAYSLVSSCLSQLFNMSPGVNTEHADQCTHPW